MIGNELFMFWKVCVEYSFKLFVVVFKDDNEYGIFYIRVYDIKLNNWYIYDMKMLLILDVVMNFEFFNMIVIDGGLVCCVLRVYSYFLLVIIVCNLLMREMKVFLVLNFLSMV